MSRSKHISIVGNIVDTIGNDPAGAISSGIYVIEGDFITISGNEVYAANDNGIEIHNDASHEATKVVISGNTVAACGGAGLSIWGLSSLGHSNVIVSDNISYGNTGDGIAIHSDPRVLRLVNNISTGNTGYGLSLTNSGLSWEINGNDFHGNTAGQISFGGSMLYPVMARSWHYTYTTAIASNTTPLTDSIPLGKGARGG